MFNAMMKGVIKPTRVGILGSGQLAKMLAEAAKNLGIGCVILAKSKDDPASQTDAEVIFGSWDDPESVKRLSQKVELLTFENEFIPDSLVDLNYTFSPPMSAMALLRDKWKQKEVLHQLAIPTAKAQLLSSQGQEAKVGEVLKWTRHGYDGYGTLILNIQADLERVSDFILRGKAKGAQVYREEKANFVRELALVSSRNSKGDMVFYPLSITEQKSGICIRVKGPAHEWGVSKHLQQEAEKASKKIAEKLSLVGSFAVEFFELKTGELWVNEIAPRVHNSGHFTLDASETSQFENHWRGTLGMDLGSTQSKPFYGMRNLLGPGSDQFKAVPQGAILHWYKKKEMRLGRKLGHINCFASTKTELEAKLSEIDQWEADWQRET